LNQFEVRNSCILPAEWHPQDGVLLTWPHTHSDWKPYLAEVEPVYQQIAAAVTARERLLVAARDADHAGHVRSLLQQVDIDPQRVHIAIAPSNDSWARDHGPITVYENGVATLLDFRFNGWGGKYESALDDRVTRTLHTAGAFDAVPIRSIDFVLEGGGIESDGLATLLTTSRCLLSKGRNPAFTREQIDARLTQLFGLKRVLWLEHGYLEGDDTDSHIDTLARFCDARTIAYVQCDDRTDPHWPELNAMEQELRAFRDNNGEPYRLIALPWPRAKYNADGKRLPATYANFLIIDGAVLMPSYRDAADVRAADRLRACFADREIVPIDCLPLIQQFGSLHCITMQLPAGAMPRV
jgi:agmatine deiminase